MEVPKFLRANGDSLLFRGDGEFIFYVPETYFGRQIAVVVGEFVNILGILNYSIFDSNGKNNGLHRFYFPTLFLTKPRAIEKQNNVKLTSNSEIQDYRLLRYSEGDAVVVSIKVPEDVTNVEMFFKAFLYGKLPTTIPYGKMHEYFPESIELNGSSYGISLQMFGIVVGGLCKDPSNLKREFRHTKYKDDTAYRAIGIIDQPKYVSPNSSIGSQNWDAAIVGAIMNPNDVESPMEKLLMGSSD